MKKLLVIGFNSDMVQAGINRLHDEYTIVGLTRKDLDLSAPDATEKIQAYLETEQPDIILHGAGNFDATDDFDVMFNINVKSHWAIIKYYFDHPPEKLVKFIQLGSSTYKQGRMKWPVYAASRAAQHSLWQGSSEAAPENLKLGIIHPCRVNTKHVAHLPPNANSIDPEDAGLAIEDMIRNMNESCFVDLDRTYIQKYHK